MILAATILGLTALSGLVMAFIRVRGAPRPPTWLAVGHGAGALTGIVLLAIAVTTGSHSSTAYIALGVFVLVALGGLTIFIGFHLHEKPLPLLLIVGHGIIAALGVVLLAVEIGRP